jgi:hypothetical protein
VGHGRCEVLRPGTPWPPPFVVGKAVDSELKKTPQGRSHWSFLGRMHNNVQVHPEHRSLQLVVNQTMEPQFIVHGQVLRRLWDSPLQVMSIRSIGYPGDLKGAVSNRQHRQRVTMRPDDSLDTPRYLSEGSTVCTVDCDHPLA